MVWNTPPHDATHNRRMRNHNRSTQGFLLLLLL